MLYVLLQVSLSSPLNVHSCLPISLPLLPSCAGTPVKYQQAVIHRRGTEEEDASLFLHLHPIVDGQHSYAGLEAGEGIYKQLSH